MGPKRNLHWKAQVGLMIWGLREMDNGEPAMEQDRHGTQPQPRYFHSQPSALFGLGQDAAIEAKNVVCGRPHAVYLKFFLGRWDAAVPDNTVGGRRDQSYKKISRTSS